MAKLPPLAPMTQINQPEVVTSRPELGAKMVDPLWQNGPAVKQEAFDPRRNICYMKSVHSVTPVKRERESSGIAANRFSQWDPVFSCFCRFRRFLYSFKWHHKRSNGHFYRILNMGSYTLD